MIRSCVSCRQAKPATTLQRLQLANDGTLKLTNRRTAGRSAWVCLNQTCIQRLIKRPQSAQRALKKRPKSTPNLFIQIRDHLETEIYRLLLHAYRSGQLRFLTNNQTIPSTALWVLKPLKTALGPETESDPIVLFPCFYFPIHRLKDVNASNSTANKAIYLGDTNADLLLRYLQEHALMR